ncbi:MAG: type II toxin-antitoxin system prevent-host-death family antitoxin [Deltaproteobacteria bacterium]|nr:MAG: type II toxin-antitoxin system prevent-host-death family antitoxin [Deltaproteobacteria bacterium]
MTISVKVGDLKNNLSAYLRKVRQGDIVTISDRDNPIGKIIPYSSQNPEEIFDIIKPTGGYDGLAKLAFSTSSITVSAVKLLLEERKKR